MTERLHFHFSLSCIGEGNGNPFQCSCLENPRDGGALWAAISGVTQSLTRLKRLSSSSSKIPNSRCQWTRAPSEVSRRSCVSLSFLVSRGQLHSLTPSSFLPPQSQQIKSSDPSLLSVLCFHCHTSFSSSPISLGGSL